MKLLKTIFDQLGFIDSVQLAELVETFPHAQVVIRWGGMPREKISAALVAKRISEVESTDADYVRDVFFDSSTMDNLRQAFGEASLY